MRMLPSQNDEFGFFGSVRSYLESWADAKSINAVQAWEIASKVVANHVPYDPGFTPKAVRFLLDAKLGRWLFDETTSYLPPTGRDDTKKLTISAAVFKKAVETAAKVNWFQKKMVNPDTLAREIGMTNATDAHEARDSGVGDAPLTEDAGDVVIYMNPDQFIERVKGKTYSRELWNRTKLALEAAASSTPVLKASHAAVLAELRKDKRLAELLKAEGLKLQNIYEGHMDDITQAVFETTEDGELPFHGELIVEGDDGQSVTLDEADVMEDVIIEAFEVEIAEAVASDPNAHSVALREIDEALAEGDYETAMEAGCALLARCGVDEARIEEFKKGFKTSATQRSRMGRMRMKAKTGTQLMALRQRRRAARKGGARMKRARYYKSNKQRIARRRAQLTNSVDLNAVQVVEMAEQGMTFVVLQDGEEPVFASSREIAEALAGDDGVVVELTQDQIEEAFKKSGKNGKPFFAKKKADDAEDEGDETDESLAEKKDCDDEDDDEDADEDDYEDDEDDEDETDESIEESEVSKLANEIAKFLKQHPRVGYGELATRFKVGRDVAQQAVILASNSAKAKGDQASWLWLAKEIMGKLMHHSAGTQSPANPKSMPAKLQVASVQDDGADLQEDDEEPVDEGSGTKSGTITVAKQSLPKPKLKGKEGAIKSAHGRGESEDDDPDAGDLIDEVDEDDPVDEGSGKKAGATKIAKQALPKPKL